MWIVDDDGDMFNTDHYTSITFARDEVYIIKLWIDGNDWFEFGLSQDLNHDERLDRYHDLIEKLTGEKLHKPCKKGCCHRGYVKDLNLDSDWKCDICNTRYRKCGD